MFEKIPHILNIIEILEDNPEEVENYRSHIIYATKSDVFVTNDN